MFDASARQNFDGNAVVSLTDDIVPFGYNAADVKMQGAEGTIIARMEQQVFKKIL